MMNAPRDIEGWPGDVEGECNRRLGVLSDSGYETATFRCQGKPGHPGRHRESFFDGRAAVEWDEGAE